MDHRRGASNSAADIKDNATSGFRKTFLCPTVSGSSSDFDPNDISVTQYTGHPRLLPDTTRIDGYRGGTGYFKQYRISRVKRASDTTIVFDASLYLVTTANNMGSGTGSGAGNQTTGYYRP